MHLLILLLLLTSSSMVLLCLDYVTTKHLWILDLNLRVVEDIVIIVDVFDYFNWLLITLFLWLWRASPPLRRIITKVRLMARIFAWISSNVLSCTLTWARLMIVVFLLLENDVFGILDMVTLSEVYMNIIWTALLTLLIKIELHISLDIILLFALWFYWCILFDTVWFWRRLSFQICCLLSIRSRGSCISWNTCEALAARKRTRFASSLELLLLKLIESSST